MPKKQKQFEALKRQLIEKRMKETFKIPLVPLFKLQYKGKGYLTDDICQKAKCIGDDSYRMLKRELYLQGLPKKQYNKKEN